MIYIILTIMIGFILYKIYETEIKDYLTDKTLVTILEPLPESQYKIYHNLILPTKNDVTLVDYVVLSPYGIFVIGTKNYKGKIAGAQNSLYWTEIINGKRYKFYNPVRQNQRQIDALKEVLQLTDERLYTSIIAFSSNSYITTQSDHIITHMDRIRSIIEDYQEIKLEKDVLDYLKQKLNMAKVDTKPIRYIHKEIIVEKEGSDAYKSRICTSVPRRHCPRCKGNLLRIQGKYGSFWGCSNYPKCKFYMK